MECVCDQDGRNFKLLTPVVYCAKYGRIFIIPRGASTDGASTPAIIASIYPPSGAYWQSAVLHDAAYRDDLRAAPAGALANLSRPDPAVVAGLPKASLAKTECDLLLLEAMRLSGVDEATCQVIYEGVRLGGQAAFDEDRRV